MYIFFTNFMRYFKSGMNKILFTILLSSLWFTGLNAQSPFWTENFSTPEGWTVENNWNITGGMLYFDWNPTIYDFDESAVSPFIQLDGHVEDVVIVQSLEVYNPTPDEMAEIIIITSEDEFIIWDYELSEGNWGGSSGTEIILPLSEFAGESIQIKFRTYGGTTFNWSWWQIHSISIMATYDYDLTVSNIQGPNNVDVGGAGDWIIEIMNQGTEDIDNYTVSLIDSKSGDIVDELESTAPLEAGQTFIYGLDYSPSLAYNTLIYCKVTADEDQLTLNDLSNGSFLRIEPDIDYKILVWNNDNGIQSIVCPEEGDLITPIEGLTRALDDAGLEYDLYNYLPDAEDLQDYDLVLSTLGCYCLS